MTSQQVDWQGDIAKTIQHGPDSAENLLLKVLASECQENGKLLRVLKIKNAFTFFLTPGAKPKFWFHRIECNPQSHFVLTSALIGVVCTIMGADNSLPFTKCYQAVRESFFSNCSGAGAGSRDSFAVKWKLCCLPKACCRWCPAFCFLRNLGHSSKADTDSHKIGRKLPELWLS